MGKPEHDPVLKSPYNFEYVHPIHFYRHLLVSTEHCFIVLGMPSLRRLLSLVVPSSILCLSWFWWRWKSKGYLKNDIESEIGEGSNLESVNDCNICSTDKSDGSKDQDDVGEIVFLELDDINSVVECNSDELLNMDTNEVKCLANCVNDIDININNVNTIKSVTNEDFSVLPLVNEKKHVGKLIVAHSDPADYYVNESGVILPDERHNIISQLSVDCVQEDLGCDEFSPVHYNTSAGKRIRNQSSCGDSAIVEDYSSDGLSITGSDSAIKSSEGEVCSLECKPMAEQECFKKALCPQENGRNYRDWYGSTLGPNNFKERPDKPRHWGSVPVTDSDSDSECILKRTAKIGSVSLDKLSIQLNDELSNIKLSGEKSNSVKSTRFPKQNRRKNKRSDSRTPNKTVTCKQSSQTRKNESRRKQRKKSNTISPKNDIDKPWRNHETGRKCEKIVIDVNAKRETVEFEFPDDMCGRLIGKSGRHITEFKESTGVDICIECELHGKNRIVSMTGAPSRIKTAERLLNEKFHDSLKVASYPDVLDVENKISPVTLPENTEVDVIVTAIVDVESFYVQIFHQDVDDKLMQLQTELSGCYVTPRQKYIYLEKEFPHVGEYCVSFIDNVWCRLQLLEVFVDTRMVDAFFIDYGGNVNLSIDLIWKIRFVIR